VRSYPHLTELARPRTGLGLRRTFVALQQQKRRRARNAVPVEVPNGLRDNCVAYWRMDESEGDRLDATPQQFHLVGWAYGSPFNPTLGSYGPQFPLVDRGYFVSADLFFTEAVEGWTMAGWFRITEGTSGGGQPFFGKPGAFWLWYDYAGFLTTVAGSLCFTYNPSGTEVTLMEPGPTGCIGLDDFFHLALVLDDNWGRVYINGESVWHWEILATIYSWGPLLIAGNGSDTLGGSVSNVGVWECALDSRQVSALYNGGVGLDFSLFTMPAN
jgi:hypothetical protein